MRPHRARLVYSLVNSYGLGKQMSVYRPEPRSFDQLTEFHADGMCIASMIADQRHACVERVTIKLLELPTLLGITITLICRIHQLSQDRDTPKCGGVHGSVEAIQYWPHGRGRLPRL